MNHISILYPLFGMFVLVNLVLFRLAYLRFISTQKKEVPLSFFKTFQGGEEPPKMRAVSRNLANLFEIPVLFYVVIILYYSMNVVTKEAIILAWAYVGFRYLHSLVHLTFNHIMVRFTFFILSNVALMILWLSLFIKYVFKFPLM